MKSYNISISIKNNKMNLHKYQSLIIVVMVALATTFTCEKLSSQDLHVEGVALIEEDLRIGTQTSVMGLTTEIDKILNLDINFRHANKDNTQLGAAFRIDIWIPHCLTIG